MNRDMMLGIVNTLITLGVLTGVVFLGVLIHDDTGDAGPYAFGIIISVIAIAFLRAIWKDV